MLLGDSGRFLRLHVHRVLLDLVVHHSRSDDVQHREHAGLRAVDDSPAQIGKAPPAGGSGIDYGGHRGPEGRVIGIDAAFGVVHRARGALGEHMNVDIDEPGSNVESGDIDHLPRRGGGYIRRYSSDAIAANGDVADVIDVILWIDNAAAFQQQIVLWRLRECSLCAKHECGSHGRDESMTRKI